MQSDSHQATDPYWRAFLFNRNLWSWLVLVLVIGIPAAISTLLDNGLTFRTFIYLLAPLLLLGGALIEANRRATNARQFWRESTGRCLRCGYILHGTESPMCPECGYVKVRESADASRSRSARDSNQGKNDNFINRR